MTGTELTRTEQATKTLVHMITGMRGEIERALPKHLDPDRIARIATTIVRGNDKLAQCTPESFLGALMTASQLGLEPGPLGEAYLVPFGNQVTFIAGYRGLIKLAFQSGMVKRIGAHVVREFDEFDYAYGLEPYLVHKPRLTERGKPVAVYGSATLHDGETPFVVLSFDEVERLRRRGRSSSGNNSPWVTDWDAMARKTAIRQLERWLPKSTDLRNFGLAVALDGGTRIDPTGSLEQQPLPELEAADPPPRATAAEITQQADENSSPS